ncbi:MAG: thiolase family protein [Chitinophagales bacterium]|nr:thiolase family protein [Chitinophagales bacterium]
MKKVVFIDGVRTPFLRAGTDYMDLMSYQLGQYAIRGLLDRTGIDPNVVDRVIYGNVISNVRTENPARESALNAGLPIKVPCNTVKQACISANQAISNSVDNIQLGRSDVIISGGTECTSDTPIGYTKPMRKKLFQAQKISKPMEYVKFAMTLSPMDFLPDRPSVTEFTTGRTMGEDCELMASRFKVGRAEQDKYAAYSHQNAGKAQEEGLLSDVIPVTLPNGKTVAKDNGVRGDTTVEKISGLKPAFNKDGTITAANASYLTDGATAVLLASEEKAKELGWQPKAEIVDYVFTAGDLYEECLLGPAYSIVKILEQTGLKLEDMDVIEIHEAFAGQVLSVVNALKSDEWCKKQLGLKKAFGEIDLNKVNTWGGSLSLGHPFGATGGRLLTMAANRLQVISGKYALLTACAAGTHGHVMIIKKIRRLKCLLLV